MPNRKNRLSASVSAIIAAASMTGLPLSLSAQTLTIEEVVVTAQKKAESVQDIPSTVNAVGGEVLDQFQIRDFSDVAAMTPGLSLDTLSPTNPAVSLRGISFNPESNARAAVETYWNETPVAVQAMFQQLYDLERIEVLRGPQGTLQGRTSPAGAVIVHTRKPSFEEVEGTIQQTVAENKAYNTQFAVSLPVADTLAVRVAGVYDSSELEGITNITNGQDQSGHTRSGRITVAWQPTDEFSATLVSEYLESFKDGFEDVKGDGTTFFPGYPAITKDRVAIHDGMSSVNQRNELNVLKMDLDLPGHQLTSVTGYRELRNHNKRDIDQVNNNSLGGLPGSAPSLELRQDVDTTREALMQEIRLSSVDTEFWEYLVGLYFEDQNISTAVEISGRSPFFPAPIIFPLPSIVTSIDTSQEQYGIFTHNRFYLSDELTLQAGFRWTKYNLTPTQTLIGPIGDESVEAVTGGVKLSYNFNEDTMAYVSLDRSYRPGNGVVSLDQQQIRNFEEEEADSIELGLKTTLWEGRAQLNGAIYYQTFDGYISRASNLLYDSDADGALDSRVSGGITYNADATIQGAEVEFNVLLSEYWTASGGLSYNDSTFDSGAEGPCVDTGMVANPGVDQIEVCDLSDQRVGGEPNWSASLNTEYTIPVDAGDVYLRGLYKLTDHRGGGSSNDVAAYGVTNLYAGLRANDGWEVSLWVKNVFDKEAEIQPRTLFGGFYTGVALLPERQVGITGTYNFSL